MCRKLRTRSAHPRRRRVPLARLAFWFSLAAWSAAWSPVAHAYCQSLSIKQASGACNAPCLTLADFTETAIRLQRIVPLAWRAPCFQWTLHPDGARDIPRAEVVAAIERAFSTWIDVPCDGAPVGFEVSRVDDPRLRCDYVDHQPNQPNLNAFIFVDDWSARGNPAAAFALTSTFFDRRTGEIFGVDMELNQQGRSWGVCPDTGCTENRIDLENVLTHEVGHWLGLAHTPDDPTATMWACTSEQETQKRTLQPDDIAGWCAIYPPGALDGTCNLLAGAPVRACSFVGNPCSPADLSRCPSGRCLPEGACTVACADAEDCPEGYRCGEAATGENQCVPAGCACAVGPMPKRSGRLGAALLVGGLLLLGRRRNQPRGQPSARRRRLRRALWPLGLGGALIACGQTESGWAAIEADQVGWLMSGGAREGTAVAVGGRRTAGRVFEVAGGELRALELPVDVPLLNWVHAFGAHDLVVVGNGGTILRHRAPGHRAPGHREQDAFRRERWERQASGTEEDLWGVWGAAPDDVWAVGGSGFPGSVATLLHYDGTSWRNAPFPELVRAQVRAFFKVWGSARDRVFVVGQQGVVLQWDGRAWTEAFAGADDDLIAVYGDAQRVFAVGGRSNGIIARFSGTTWRSERLTPLPGLNGVWLTPRGELFAAGSRGTLLSVDPDKLEVKDDQSLPESRAFHALFGSDDRLWAVGGNLLASSSTEERGLMWMRALR